MNFLNITQNTRSYFFIFLLYALLSLSILAPIAVNEALPESVPDFQAHISGIIQARLALEEGQFPIRIAPIEHEKLRYPEFQFYSPLTYTIAGTIYKLITPANPFLALKISICLALVISGVYIYRLAKQVAQDTTAAILAGATYMMAPYFIININYRGDLTEVVGQGILPVVLYYTCQPFFKKRVFFNNYVISAVMWSFLAMIHLITFVNASITIGLFIIFFIKRNNFIKVIFTGLAYGFGFLLSVWYLAPVIIYHSLLNISKSLFNPVDSNFMTLLPRLFSVASTSLFYSYTIYQDNETDRWVRIPFCTAIGWVTLLSVGVCVYALLTKQKNIDYFSRFLLNRLLLMFFIAFFITWSPFNFWQYIPKLLVIEQFSYRFLVQLMWVGVLLVSIAITLLSNKKNPMQVLFLGLFTIGFASSSWLMENYTHGLPVKNVIAKHSFNYGTNAFLIKKRAIAYSHGFFYIDDSVEEGTVGWLQLNSPTAISNKTLQENKFFRLKGEVPTTIFTKPLVLTVRLNDQIIFTQAVNPGLFSLDIPIPSKLLLDSSGVTNIYFDTDPYFIPKEIMPPSVDTRHLSIKVEDFRSISQNEPLLMDYHAARSYCSYVGATLQCYFIVPTGSLIELPMLYYPKLINVLVDGIKTNYQPIWHKDKYLLGLKLSPGKHNISAKFTGLAWANWISLIAWCGMLTWLAVTWLVVNLFRRLI
jgi:hypothetical protein